MALIEWFGTAEMNRVNSWYGPAWRLGCKYEICAVMKYMKWGGCTLGLGEIGPEDPNFKIKTWALGF